MPLDRYSQAEKLDILRADRRALHRIPEIRFELPKTRAYVRSVLEGLKPDCLQEIAGGIKCVFRADKPEKPAIALRADMDALCVTEETGLEWASTHEGKMHACGHDGHMASLLLTAREIARNRASLKRDTVLIFQPAEEGGDGAHGMTDAGVLHNPEVAEVLGMHVWPDYPVGTLAVKPGPLMASITIVDVIITGRSAHGATPSKGCDALLAGAQFVQAVYAALRAKTDPFEPTILSFGQMEAGTARNVVAAGAVLRGTIRAYSDASEKQVLSIIEQCLRASVLAYGCTGEVKVPGRHAAVVNNEELTGRVKALMGGGYAEAAPVLISEDFSDYQKHVPGVFFFTGCRDEAHTSPLHTGRFWYDEEALLPAEEVFIKAVFEEE